MKGVLAGAILFFISQPVLSQNNLLKKDNPFLRTVPDSVMEKLFKQLKTDSLVITRQNGFRGLYNNMPVITPDSNFTDIMPHYSPPPGFHSNMPVIPFIYENEKQHPSDKKIKK